MTSQDYVNQALAAGLSQSTIDSFIANNPGDYGRIWSAFNLGSTSAGSGSSGASLSPAALAVATGGMAALPTVPGLETAIARSSGAMPQPGPGDMVVTGDLAGLFGGGGPVAAALSPASGIDWKQIALYAAIALAVAYVAKKVIK